MTIHIEIEIDNKATNEKLAAYQAAWNMGLKVRVENIYALIGATPIARP